MKKSTRILCLVLAGVFVLGIIVSIIVSIAYSIGV